MCENCCYAVSRNYLTGTVSHQHWLMNINAYKYSQLFDHSYIGRAVFTQKQVFSPRTAISQPIWIKFCTHLLFYGIRLWADLDRDWHVGGSRPNQNDYVFVILVTHPKWETDRRDFGGITSEWR